MKTSNYLDPERLAKLQQRIWDVATAHGWHEQPISTAQYCGLIMTEMAEAIEADRNGRRADMESFNERMSNLDGSDECFKEMYKRYVKGSIEEEFADVVIRVLDMAQEVHAQIRAILADLYGADAAETVRILYGGSMKPANAPELLAKKDIDGGLIGGASLKAPDFLALVAAGANA